MGTFLQSGCGFWYAEYERDCMERIRYCGSQERERFTCNPSFREHNTSDGAGSGYAAGPDTHESGRCAIPPRHAYPPASRGNAVLIPVRTNCTAMAMSSIPIRRFIARYSRWPIFDMI